jgi:two-component system, chemotaxis family, protein-glutamate methylesterase/glutaminase
MAALEALPRWIEAVAIGTSAGGIEALSQLLPALPARLQASVFIVQHVPRERPNQLLDVLQPKCPVPMREPEDKEPVAHGTVYMAPPDYHMLIEHGPQLALSVDDPVEFSRPSIDVLFESAADVYGRHLLGIVLTGGNQDGAAGLDTVHRAGGITVVQDPQRAYKSFMPAAALKRNPAHPVLALERIASLLGTLQTARGVSLAAPE